MELAFVQLGGKPFNGTDDAQWFQFLGASLGASSEWEEKANRKNGSEEKIAKQFSEGDLALLNLEKKELKVIYIPFGFI